MSALRWFKFDPLAWRSDPALRCVSLAARGLWIELLGIMHAAPERGVLTINGKAPSVRQIAANVNSTVEEVTATLSELEVNEVCSRTPEGMICSRRMLRDTADQLESAAAGVKGAEKRWAKGGGMATPIAPPMGEGNTSARARAPLFSSLSGSSSVSDSSLESTAEPVAVQAAPVPSESAEPAPPRRRPSAATWDAALADPEFDRLRADSGWMEAWAAWIEHAGSPGVKAKVPRAPRAKQIFRDALRVGPAMHVAAIRASIRNDWQGVDPSWIKPGSLDFEEAKASAGAAKDRAERLAEAKARAEQIAADIPLMESGSPEGLRLIGQWRQHGQTDAEVIASLKAQIERARRA